MTRYLISFPSGAMDHIPAREFPAVGEAARAVVKEAMDAGVWVFGGGLAESVDPVMVTADGTNTPGTYPQTKEFNGGFTYSTCPLARQPWSGPPRSQPPAAVLRRSASSCPIQRWVTSEPKIAIHAHEIALHAQARAYLALIEEVPRPFRENARIGFRTNA